MFRGRKWFTWPKPALSSVGFSYLMSIWSDFACIHFTGPGHLAWKGCTTKKEKSGGKKKTCYSYFSYSLFVFSYSPFIMILIKALACHNCSHSMFGLHKCSANVDGCFFFLHQPLIIFMLVCHAIFFPDYCL